MEGAGVDAEHTFNFDYALHCQANVSFMVLTLMLPWIAVVFSLSSVVNRVGALISGQSSLVDQ